MDTAAINHGSMLGQRGTAVWPAVVGLLAAAVLCGACKGQPAPVATVTASPPTVAAPVPTPTSTPSLIRVVKVLPTTAIRSNDQYHLNNCGGIVELRRPFSEVAQVRTQVALSDQATASDGTTIPLLDPLRSQLMTEVSCAYQEQLDAARATVEQYEMVAGAQTRWYITVIWEEAVFAASLSFPSDGITAMAAYTYTQTVPIMGSVKPMPCTA